MRLLVVGRLSGQLSSAVKLAMAAGAKVAHVETCEAATYALRAGQGADLLMVDYELDIAALIAANEAERIRVPVVACGVGADSKRAADAIRAGAKEFIPLPPEADLIAAVLAAVADDDRPMVARDPAMQAVIALADQVAASEASILITGESGVGKEVMARYVHNKSRRAARPFISVNCAAIPENLLESELFGHEKGAFTGAVARRIGKFEEANGGTLLLDEICEMDGRLQAKLLRALQEREIDRVGGAKPVKVDIRVIATSNRDLAQAVRDGTFREDLLYRLNVVNLRLPPLRERPGDIVALAEHFVEEVRRGQRHRRSGRSRPRRASRLVAHRWPGNVRELENAMHRAVLLAAGPEIEEFAIRLPDGAPMPASPGAETARAASIAAEAASRAFVGQTVAAVEQQLIIDTLEPLPRQPHPRGQHPRHLDPHPAEQAQGILRRRHFGAAAAAAERGQRRLTHDLASLHPSRPDRRRGRGPLGRALRSPRDAFAAHRGAASAGGWAWRRSTCASGAELGHRADERFADVQHLQGDGGAGGAGAASTPATSGSTASSRYGKADLLEHAPVTSAHLANGGMAVRRPLRRGDRASATTPRPTSILASIGGPAGWTRLRALARRPVEPPRPQRARR